MENGGGCYATHETTNVMAYISLLFIIWNLRYQNIATFKIYIGYIYRLKNLSLTQILI